MAFFFLILRWHIFEVMHFMKLWNMIHHSAELRDEILDHFLSKKVFKCCCEDWLRQIGFIAEYSISNVEHTAIGRKITQLNFAVFTHYARDRFPIFLRLSRSFIIWPHPTIQRLSGTLTLTLSKITKKWLKGGKSARAWNQRTWKGIWFVIKFSYFIVKQYTGRFND